MFLNFCSRLFIMKYVVSRMKMDLQPCYVIQIYNISTKENCARKTVQGKLCKETMILATQNGECNNIRDLKSKLILYSYFKTGL